MLRTFKRYIFTFLIIIIGLYLYVDDFFPSKYFILHTVTSLFQKEYKYSAYYQYKVPKEWIEINNDDKYDLFIGPTYNQEKKFTVIQVFTDFNEVKNMFRYFDPKYCKKIDKVVTINNDLDFYWDNQSETIIEPVEASANIIFCNSDENNNSYISYENAAAITHIVIKPYDSRYREEYIKLFSNIDYKVIEIEIPKWTLKQ